MSALLTRGLPENPLTRAAAYLGSYSYSVYLWHAPLLLWGVRWLDDAGFPGSVAWLVYFAGSIAVGIAMGRLVEMPVLRLRGRIFPSRSKALLEGSGPRPGSRHVEPKRGDSSDPQA